MEEVFISTSPDETQKFAQKLAQGLKGGEIFAFSGNLGAGKTCFVKGLARGLGYDGDVTSPTFALVNEYRGGRLDLFHFDMYRITSWDDLYSTGYFEYADECAVMAVEWSENIEAALPGNAIRVDIRILDEDKRRITVKRG